MQPLSRPRQPLRCDAESRREARSEGSHRVGRALAQLGVEHIAAFSPQAPGRSERAFRTLQDRLPKELALKGIDDVEAANDFLEGLLPKWNSRFAVQPEQPGTAFVPVGEAQLRQILCIEEPRQVGNDNTATFHRHRLQIPPSPLRPVPRRNLRHLPRAMRNRPLRRHRRPAGPPA